MGIALGAHRKFVNGKASSPFFLTLAYTNYLFTPSFPHFSYAKHNNDYDRPTDLKNWASKYIVVDIGPTDNA